MKKITRSIYLLLPYFFVFLATLYQPRDFDMGWHLKYGEYFFKQGQILRDNTFSQEMPNYKWVNSSWATDLITYTVFHISGFFGLTLLGASVATATFFFFSKAYRLEFWYQALLFPLIVFIESPINLVSFRGQQLTLLFLGILFFILSRYSEHKKKIIWWVVPLFFLWVNFHGEYILGLAIFCLWIFLHAIKEISFLHKNIKQELEEIKLFALLVGFVFLATLINPFGIDVYKEAFHHFGNPWQKYIVEWTQFSFGSSLWWIHVGVGILLGFGILSIVLNDSLNENIENIGVSATLFFLGLWMRRYAWPGYYLSLPLFVGSVEAFKPKNSVSTTKIGAILLILFFICTVFLKWPFNQFSSASWQTYCDQFIHCSQDAISYLKTHNSYKKLFTLYGWGGWMIWNHPEIKPTIDGRMHLWTDDKGYSAFANYYPIEQNWKDIDKTNYDAVFFSKEKPLYKRLKELVVEKKWELVYEDTFSVIFYKKPSVIN